MSAPGWPVVLRHGDVGLRPLRRSDAPRWREIRRRNTRWLGPWEGSLPPEAGQAAASYRAMVVTLRRRARRGFGMPFVVTESDRMVGMLNVSNIVWGSMRSASLGYWIEQETAGRGVIPTAVALTCDHLFTTARLHRIEISIRPENTASLRVVEKLGFTEIGLAPRFLHIAGDWRDHRLFQLVAEDARGGVIDRLSTVR